MKIALPAIIALMATGELVGPTIPGLGEITHLGAVGVLCWVCWAQFREIRSQRKENNQIMQALREQMNAVEGMRHDDSTNLNNTLRKMSAQLARTQGAMKDKGK